MQMSGLPLTTWCGLRQVRYGREGLGAWRNLGFFFLWVLLGVPSADLDLLCMLFVIRYDRDIPTVQYSRSLSPHRGPELPRPPPHRRLDTVYVTASPVLTSKALAMALLL